MRQYTDRTLNFPQDFTFSFIKTHVLFMVKITEEDDIYNLYKKLIKIGR